MAKYKNVRLTQEEYDMINQIRDGMAKKGLPLEFLEDRSLGEYLESVDRDSLAKGALVGLGIAALAYLIAKK